METVIIVIHLMVIVALVAVILLQRSDGGALGIGGSSSGFMSTRGTGNVLTRSTAILAAAFFATSIALTMLARVGGTGGSILDAAPLQGQSTPGTAGGSLLDQLNKPATGSATPGAPAAPAAPAAPSVPNSQ